MGETVQVHLHRGRDGRCTICARPHYLSTYLRETLGALGHRKAKERETGKIEKEKERVEEEETEEDEGE